MVGYLHVYLFDNDIFEIFLMPTRVHQVFENTAINKRTGILK